MQVQNYHNNNCNYNPNFKAKVEFSGDTTYFSKSLQDICKDIGSRIGRESDVIKFNFGKPHTYCREEYSDRDIHVTTCINGKYIDIEKFIGYHNRNEGHTELTKNNVFEYMNKLSNLGEELATNIISILRDLNTKQLESVLDYAKFVRDKKSK